MSFYRTLLAAIEETTETAGSEILSHCRREEVVESRRLFVLIAKEYGATTDAIANFLRITPAGVRSIFYNKKEKGKIFEINHTKIKKKLESNHGTFSKKLAAFAISLMKGKDTDTEKLAKITPRGIEEIREIMQKYKIEIPEKHIYTAQYLFNMAIADYPKTLKTDEQRATFVGETINDPDGDPAAVLECFTAKMAVAGIPIRWEELR